MKIEKTLVLMKPDAVQRCIVGRILARFEDAGLKIIAMKMAWVDKSFAEKHYRDIKERYDKRILDNLTAYLREGPVIALVLEGIEAIKIVRKLVGETPYPDECSPGTIRGDFAHISKVYANKHEKKVGNL
ncbi:MAG: nucleoside-diphosphate kinase, partial [archaeon]